MRVFGAEPPAFLLELIDAMTERGRALVGWRPSAGPVTAPDLSQLGELILSRRGEASGVVLARSLVEAYAIASPEERIAFLKVLAERFGPEPAEVEAAFLAWKQGKPGSVEALHKASEPRRQELFRRINMSPGGTRALVKMREDLLAAMRENPDLNAVNADFQHLLSSWFNRGFLSLRQIDWNTPASILEKVIRYEAVHQIRNWDDLRNRLEPTDRRCYAFFHPQLVDEPLIFVEVGLTRTIPDAIAPLLDLERKPIAAEDANTAVFYSISNTQRGLAGVSFGNFLIKQVVELLKAELPGIQTFVTLSPVPGFSKWLAQHKAAGHLSREQQSALALVDQPGWHNDVTSSNTVNEVLLPIAAQYFLEAKDKAGRPIDPVARFHLGNGARLERLNPMGDVSDSGLRQSYGLMVNYLYALDEIERNHEAFAERGAIASPDALRRLSSNT
ncbi:MAG: malonyl-CoA decarboxylase [Devosia sp.]|nr:malonyl-CoA decarboxylase [Devosia sp.]